MCMKTKIADGSRKSFPWIKAYLQTVHFLEHKFFEIYSV